jgi:type I restriction enzyme S subunit
LSPETLLRQFDVLADAPNGVQKLRELILQLAVRGKLVPQDPRDEPASVLLERIAAEKQRLVDEGRMGQSKPLPPIRDDEVPFEIPEGWRWGRFLDVASIASNLVDPIDYSDEPHIAPDSIEKGTGRLLPYRSVREDAVRSNKHRFLPGQILYSKIRPNLSKAVLIDFGGLCSADMYPVDAYISSAYLLKYILSSTFLSMAVRSDTRVAMPKINQAELSRVLVPVPPLAEQRRIVAKVDELMALCDKLGAQQQRRAEVRARLNRSALHHLTTASDDAALFAHWQRLRENFHLLYDTPETVAELRQTVRQLAVRGKLVPQDLSDEPASVLLERIATEKRRLCDEGKIARLKPLLPIREGEPPFVVPHGWKWVRLGSLIDPYRSLSYGVLVPGPDVDTGVPFVRVQDVSAQTRHARPRKSIDPAIEARYARTRLQGGEILISVVGSIGTVGIAPPEWAGANIARALCRFAPAAELNRDYLALVLRSPAAQSYFIGATRTLAQPTLNVAQLEITTIPLPPLPEQRRIVAKVDELMAFCDKLEARLTSAREKSAHLAASVAHHLTAA